MTKIAIVPDSLGGPEPAFRAVGAGRQSVGRTPGEALDAITAQLSDLESGTLVVVQNFRPDAFFSADQRRRMDELMTRWRSARDWGRPLPAAEQAELLKRPPGGRLPSPPVRPGESPLRRRRLTGRPSV